MFLIAWVILGAISGLIVHRVVDRPEVGLVGDGVLGIFGAFIGGFVFNVLSAKGAAAFNPWSLLSAVVGAMLMLGAFHTLRRTGHGFR